jgi:small conductance mechanosensitive channel
MTTLLQSLVMYIIYFIALLMILQELHVKTTSILASAGILGLVAGLGAQNLVKDVIAGFFMVLEDHFTVGDYVQIGSLAGFVTEFGLRATRLTDWGGEIHIIPNGQITQITNHSRSNRRALVDIKIAYQEEPGKVMEVLKEIAGEARDEMDYIKDGPTILGIQDFMDNSYVVRMVAMTEPLRQEELERELRLRIKTRFDAEKIRMQGIPGFIAAGKGQDGAKKV